MNRSNDPYAGGPPPPQQQQPYQQNQPYQQGIGQQQQPYHYQQQQGHPNVHMNANYGQQAPVDHGRQHIQAPQVLHVPLSAGYHPQQQQQQQHHHPAMPGPRGPIHVAPRPPPPPNVVIGTQPTAQQQHQQQLQQRQQNEEEQMLSLKVMRIYKPRMNEAKVGLGFHMWDSRIWTQGDAGCLLLPGNFGKIYIGQVFGCFISVCSNGLSPEVCNISIRAELEANGTRSVLLDKREAPNEAAKFGKLDVARPGETLEMIVEKELVSIGPHMLRVSVEFDSASTPGTRRSIRKHYKFQVEKPISFSCKFEQVGPNRLLGQATVKNLAKGDLLLSHIEMIPINDEDWTTSNVKLEDADKKDLYSKEPVLLGSGKTRNFLFLVKPKKGKEQTVAILEPGAPIARILTRWRTEFSEQGRLMSQPLSWRTSNVQADVSIAMNEKGGNLRVGQPTTVEYSVTNQLDVAIDAQISIKPHTGENTNILIMGTTKISIGVIQPKAVWKGTLSILALSPGLHQVHGISVLDKTSKRRFTIDDTRAPSIFAQ